MKPYSIVQLARDFANKAQIKLRYGGEPYSFHNHAVRTVLCRFGHYGLTLHAAAEMHDVFEDTDSTAEDALKYGIDEEAIHIALLVTDEPGCNRRDRKAKTYPKIASDRRATILKLADRIANVESGGKIEMYRKEMPEFYAALHKDDAEIQPMWEHLIELLT